MNPKKKLDDVWESNLAQLSVSERAFFKKLRSKLGGIYKFAKPILVSFGMFYIYQRLYNNIGFEKSIYIAVVSCLIFLRLIYTKINKD